MTRGELRNVLCIMRSIDRWELVERGVIHDGDKGDKDWENFRRNPYDWFIKAPDQQQHGLWELIMDRHKPT